MTGKTLDIDDIIVPDDLARAIVNKYQTWKIAREPWELERSTLRDYLFATSTLSTVNKHLPWKNNTHRPKLTQIRDNLHSNYMAALFPKRNWFTFIGGDEEAETKEKREAIEAYVSDKVRLSGFRTEMSKLVLDFIDYGNAFAMVDFVHEKIEDQDTSGQRTGYYGPVLRRISPYDIVFNPLAPTFKESPKIVRTLVSKGEFKRMLDEEPDKGYVEGILRRMQDMRQQIFQHAGEDFEKHNALAIDGFSNFHEYLNSDVVELLHFFGDLYDENSGTFKKNRIITIADRSYIAQDAPLQTFSGRPSIFHVGWRLRPDNLYAQGPLDNLVGLQYRLNHLENLKSDVFDLVAFPPLKIKGEVSDFDWGPFEKIYVSDDGDVDALEIDPVALNADLQIPAIERTMEEMAGAPREAMGIRTPGEKTAFEVAELQNAASRVFQNKVQYFEEMFVEPILNAYLEIGRRNVNTSDNIRVFNNELQAATFAQVTKEDLTAAGAIQAIGARHFAEKSETVQNLVNVLNSAVGQDPAVMAHVSGIKIAKMIEDVLDLERYGLVQENVRISEQADTQRILNSSQQSVAEEDETTGIGEAQFQATEQISSGQGLG